MNRTKYLLLLISSVILTSGISITYTTQAQMNMSAKPFDPFANEFQKSSNSNNLSDTQKAVVAQLQGLVEMPNKTVPTVPAPNDSSSNTTTMLQKALQNSTPDVKNTLGALLIKPQQPVSNKTNITATTIQQNNTSTQPPKQTVSGSGNITVQGLSKSIESNTSTPLTISDLNQYFKLGIYHIMGNIVNVDTNTSAAYTNLYLKITVLDKQSKIIGIKQAALDIQKLVPNMPEPFDVTLTDNDIATNIFQVDGYSIHIYGQKLK